MNLINISVITWVFREAPHSWRHRSVWRGRAGPPSRPRAAAGCLGRIRIRNMKKKRMVRIKTIFHLISGCLGIRIRTRIRIMMRVRIRISNSRSQGGRKFSGNPRSGLGLRYWGLWLRRKRMIRIKMKMNLWLLSHKFAVSTDIFKIFIFATFHILISYFWSIYLCCVCRHFWYIHVLSGTSRPCLDSVAKKEIWYIFLSLITTIFTV